MHYYNPENREPHRWGIIATVIYIVTVGVLMYTMSFSVEQTDPADQGILVQFGESESGVGEEDLAATDVASTPPTPQEQAEQELLTDDNQDIEIEAAEQHEQVDVAQTQPETSQEKRDTVVEQRVVNKAAMFPGRKEGSKATSKGNSQDAGNQGSESGGAEGAAKGGGGDDGYEIDVDLKDRRVVGSLPKPSYNSNKTGTVVIEIVVDDLGYVKSASLSTKGSTVLDSRLVEAARQAALKARFTEGKSAVQGGTITYHFKMN